MNLLIYRSNRPENHVVYTLGLHLVYTSVYTENRMNSGFISICKPCKPKYLRKVIIVVSAYHKKVL